MHQDIIEARNIVKENDNTEWSTFLIRAPRSQADSYVVDPVVAESGRRKRRPAGWSEARLRLKVSACPPVRPSVCLYVCSLACSLSRTRKVSSFDPHIVRDRVARSPHSKALRNLAPSFSGEERTSERKEDLSVRSPLAFLLSFRGLAIQNKTVGRS